MREDRTSRLTFGLVAGLAYGILTVASMLPMTFPDKRAALLGAFINRFAIGLLIPLVDIAAPRWAIGLALGVLLSLPDGIITQAFAPIVGLGAVGGLVIGWLAGRGHAFSARPAQWGSGAAIAGFVLLHVRRVARRSRN